MAIVANGSQPRTFLGSNWSFQVRPRFLLTTIMSMPTALNMPKDAEPLSNWLQYQPSTVRGLLARAQRLSQINRALQEQWPEEPWIQSIRIANIRGNTVVVYAQTAAAIIPLRYRREALLAFLRQRFELTCLEIDAKVRPDY